MRQATQPALGLISLELTQQQAEATLIAIHVLDEKLKHPEATIKQCIDSGMRFYSFKERPRFTLEEDINLAGDAIFEPLHLSTSSTLDDVIAGEIAIDDLTDDGVNELIQEIHIRHYGLDLGAEPS